jgi:mRNA interferase MazF
VLLRRPETGLDRDSKAQAEQVRSVSAERAGARLGQVPAAVMTELDQALRTHLGP